VSLKDKKRATIKSANNKLTGYLAELVTESRTETACVNEAKRVKTSEIAIRIVHFVKKIFLKFVV